MTNLLNEEELFGAAYVSSRFNRCDAYAVAIVLVDVSTAVV